MKFKNLFTTATIVISSALLSANPSLGYEIPKNTSNAIKVENTEILQKLSKGIHFKLLKPSPVSNSACTVY